MAAGPRWVWKLTDDGDDMGPGLALKLDGGPAFVVQSLAQAERTGWWIIILRPGLGGG